MQVVALDWGRHRVRAAVALARPTGAKLLQVASVERGEDPAATARTLREALPDVKWSRTTVISTVGGDRVAFRKLTLPPTPDAELPGMVRLLADREFGAADEGAVDYVPIKGDAESGHDVLAARVSEATLADVKKLGDSLDAQIQRVVVRALAAVEAAGLEDSGHQGATMLLVAAGGEADMVVIDADGKAAMVRTTRLEASHTPPMGEVRRTLASAAMQLGQPVKSVQAIGFDPDELGPKTEAERLPVRSLLAEQFGLPEDQLDLAERMFGVVGAAIAEAKGDKPAIDLLNPRQPESDHAKLRRRALLLGAAAAVLLAGVVQLYWSLTAYDRETAELQSQLNVIEQNIEKLAPYRMQSEAIDAWRATDVNWLDELDQFSRAIRPEPLDAEDFPAENDAMLTNLTLGAPLARDARGGRIEFDALVRDSSVASLIEGRLRGPERRVQQRLLEQYDAGGDYDWKYLATLEMPPAGDLVKITAPQEDAVQENAPAEAPSEPSGSPKPSADAEPEEASP